ncbi:hypothetical protein [Vibrio sp. D431a]|uniref:hypothetical protein n=1 Tax=Vibrio sp. D431a TaxID=2837388 RepID=UPI002554BC50|nr:hypothetical protein [Vibrio sp. D431a]MDK9790052.1 hypothetical protein [Vibrio sp. D431a]
MCTNEIRFGDKVIKISIVIPKVMGLGEMPYHITVKRDVTVSKSTKKKFTVDSVEYSQLPEIGFQKCLMNNQRSAFILDEADLPKALDLAKSIIKENLEASKASLESQLELIHSDLSAFDSRLIIKDQCK